MRIRPTAVLTTALLCASLFVFRAAAAQDTTAEEEPAQTRSIETCNAGETTTDRGLPDGDADGVADAIDNCLVAANTDQRDTNGDGVGNLCDGDLNNDGVVNVQDLAQLRANFFKPDPDPDADLDGDGGVTISDLGILRGLFFEPPGPVGPCLRFSELCEGPVLLQVSDHVGSTTANHFMIRADDPAAVYHAKRLLSGASECNPAIAGYTYLGTKEWNPDWGYHIAGEIYFHGDSINASISCNKTATFVQSNLAVWCSIDTRAPADSSACQFWCPWDSGLIGAMPDIDGP